MRRHALAAILALTAAGCGGTHHTSPAKAAQAPAPAPSKTACDPGDDTCIPPDHPSSGPVAVPALAVGQTTHLQLPTANGTAQVDFTLTGLKLLPATADNKAGTRDLCFGFKLKNTGTLSWKVDDMTSGIDWKWFGLDGEEKDDTDAGIAGECDEYGTEFAGLLQPAPLPGKFVKGYYSFAVPSKPGAVEVTDSQDTPLFRLNYGPQSAQVPIDARGQ